MFALVDVDSVIDVGCGSGGWLAVARELGAGRCTGVEGAWAQRWVDRGVVDPAIELVVQDLEQPLVLTRRSDLAICLEVAEHLDPTRGRSLVDELCQAGRVVLFGAAMPGQGGTHHVNERWPSEWAGEFARNGWQPLDVLRSRLWADDTIPFWYRQNMILYVPTADWDAIADRVPRLPPPPSTIPLDLVHPALWLRGPSVRDQVRIVFRLPMALARKLRYRWRRWRGAGAKPGA